MAATTAGKKVLTENTVTSQGLPTIGTQALMNVISESVSYTHLMGKEDIRFSGGKESVTPDKATGSARLESLKSMLAGNKR